MFLALAAHLLADDEPPAETPAKPIKTGACRHCGKPIGRGVFLHEKRCGAKK